MNNGVGVPQSIVLFGGTSDIGIAILRKIVRPGVTRLVLVSRDVEAANRAVQPIVGDHPDLDVHHVSYDATDPNSTITAVADAVTHAGDIDLAVIAQGVLDDSDFYGDPLSVVPMVQVNFTTTMVIMYALARKMRSQGYGKMVLLSSVAGERVRKANAAYGATKAGIDGFALALDHDLEGSGVSILVVRPGFVESKMTRGLKKVPFSSTPDQVASAVDKGLRSGSRIVWVPTILRPLFMIFRHLPTLVWRRLPL